MLGRFNIIDMLGMSVQQYLTCRECSAEIDMRGASSSTWQVDGSVLCVWIAGGQFR